MATSVISINGVEILKEHGYTEEKIQAMLDSGAMYVWKA